MDQLKATIEEIILDAFGIKMSVVLSRPESQFGDLACNVALQLAKQLGKNPRDIAQQLAEVLQTTKPNIVQQAEVAGPGFINITLSDTALLSQLEKAIVVEQALANKIVVVEYSDPNPFKILHAGHLYTSVVGDAIANLLETAGATVHRVNFGGDVGLHVGKTMWAMIRSLGGEQPEALKKYSTTEERTQWLADCYIEGTNAYEDDEAARAEIIVLNKQVYGVHSNKDRQSSLAQIYWTARQWSYDYFDAFYEKIGTHFEKYYPESEVADEGLRIVKEHVTPGIFEESEGAIVFKGEPHGLHTRVFINSQGLPTYETKDIGLIFRKKEEFNFDRSVVITGNEQQQYMSVVLKAIEQFAPELVAATSHLTHGLVKLAGGEKMSSRKGNILRAVDVLDAAAEANQLATGKNDVAVELGAVKYSFLKIRTGGDIVYDPAESVSIEGNSGPYLQYAHARAKSILAKAQKQTLVIPESLDISERALVGKLSENTEVIDRAVQDLAPHLVATYLYELAQTFNRFYEKNRVIGDPREAERLYMISLYATVLKNGLGLLGIQAPEKM